MHVWYHLRVPTYHCINNDGYDKQTKLVYTNFDYVVRAEIYAIWHVKSSTTERHY